MDVRKKGKISAQYLQNYAKEGQKNSQGVRISLYHMSTKLRFLFDKYGLLKFLFLYFIFFNNVYILFNFQKHLVKFGYIEENGTKNKEKVKQALKRYQKMMRLPPTGNETMLLKGHSHVI